MSPRPFALALALLGGCAVEAGEVFVAPHRNGLIPVAQIEQPTPGPHLAQIAALDDRWVYVANSNDVLAVYELSASEPAAWAGPEDPLADWPHVGEPQGQPGLELRLDRAEGVDEVRCTTLAVHAPTRSLYCGSDDGRGLARFDLAQPDRPSLDLPTWSPEPLHVRDLAVVGDRLWLARYDRGLSSVSIDAQGRLGVLEDLELAGNFRRLASDDQGRIWALTQDRGLLVLAVDELGVTEIAGAPLEGPPLDLAVHANEAIVGLGSAGARILALSDAGTLESIASLRPPGVVSAVDLRDDVAAVVTLTGAWIYDRRDRSVEPRPAGFRNSGAWHFGERTGSMLYAGFVGGDLLVTDWTWVERFAVDPSGEVTGVDLPRAVYVASDAASVEVPLRNVGGFEQRVDVYGLGGEAIESFVLAPFVDEVRSYPADRFEIAVPEFLTFLVHEGDGVIAKLSTVVLRRPSDADLPLAVHGKPAPGQAFPAVALGQGPKESMTPLWLPLPGVRQRVVFYGSDCVAMWPEVEDVAWRVASGELGSGTAVLAAHQNVLTDGVIARWALEGVPWGVFGPAELGEALVGLNPWTELYDQGFGLPELPGAAYHPTDYEIDEQGEVVLVEREYRGAHPLR
ncbi:hypothetical protein ACNOYE_35400 [Nannocystaceae bacterium ST9]